MRASYRRVSSHVRILVFTDSGGCYQPSTSASIQPAGASACKKNGGYLATVHDANKDFFLQGRQGAVENNKENTSSEYPPKTSFFIGYQRKNGIWTWADNVSDIEPHS